MSQTEYLTSLSIDCIIFGFDEGELKVLLKKNANKEWELPGGTVSQDEDLDDAAGRIVKKVTGLRSVFVEQLYTFGNVKKASGERAISIAYYALAKITDYNALEKSEHTQWFPFSSTPVLGANQFKMLEVGFSRLENDIKFQPIAFEVLPLKFTLTEIQNIYEVILKTTLDKRNFRKKILGMDLLVKLDDYQTGAPHRAARLFTFDNKKYLELKTKGFMFEI